jgi:site-specific DNA-methyltransferase (adenine-specific)
MNINLEDNQSYFADVLDGIKLIPNEWADILLIDPPYNIGKDFGNCSDNLDLQEYVEWAEQWISEGIKKLKLSGTGYVYGYSEILAHLSVRIKLPQRWLIWHYTNKNCKSNFWQRSHESIICFWNKNRIFNLDDVREPYTKVFLKNAAGKVRKGTLGRYSRTGKPTIYKAHDKGAMPRDVVKIAALAGGAGNKERFFLCKNCNNLFPVSEQQKHNEHKIILHQTQKPQELTVRLLKAAKPATGGCVLVPFAGSGSELLAAKSLGMFSVGFDNNPDYVNMANRLINDGFPCRLKNLFGLSGYSGYYC